jgi:hypothetical protein
MGVWLRMDLKKWRKESGVRRRLLPTDSCLAHNPRGQPILPISSSCRTLNSHSHPHRLAIWDFIWERVPLGVHVKLVTRSNGSVSCILIGYLIEELGPVSNFGALYSSTFSTYFPRTEWNGQFIVPTSDLDKFQDPMLMLKILSVVCFPSLSLVRELKGESSESEPWFLVQHVLQVNSLSRSVPVPNLVFGAPNPGHPLAPGTLLRRREELSDLRLVCDGEPPVPLHSLLLYMHSPHFASVLENSTDPTTIRIPFPCTSQALDYLLDLLYNGFLEVNSTELLSLVDLLRLCDFLLLPFRAQIVQLLNASIKTGGRIDPDTLWMLLEAFVALRLPEYFLGCIGPMLALNAFHHPKFKSRLMRDFAQIGDFIHCKYLSEPFTLGLCRDG